MNHEIQYAAHTKIESLNNELVLFSVIKEATPKIFKMASFSENKIVFENSEYSNPNKVVYEWVTQNLYKRTISGIENDKPTSDTFEFKRINKILRISFPIFAAIFNAFNLKGNDFSNIYRLYRNICICHKWNFSRS